MHIEGGGEGLSPKLGARDNVMTGNLVLDSFGGNFFQDFALDTSSLVRAQPHVVGGVWGNVWGDWGWWGKELEMKDLAQSLSLVAGTCIGDV